MKGLDLKRLSSFFTTILLIIIAEDGNLQQSYYAKSILEGTTIF